MALGSDFGTRGKGEGNEGGKGREKQTDSKPKLSDSAKVEEEKEEEYMAGQKIEWMTYGPLSLPGDFHKIPNNLERMMRKDDLDKGVNAKYYLDKFYLQIQTLEVWYGEVSCILFPCTLDGCAIVWYHNLPINSINKWGMFKHIFLEFFFMKRP